MKTFNALLGAFLFFAPSNALLAGSAVAQGKWTTLPYTMPIDPIHISLLHTGKVLIVSGSENEPEEHNDGISRAAVWDWKTGAITTQAFTFFDLFCNGMAALPDGRLFIAGGTEYYEPFTGEARAAIFDPATEKFVQVESMAHGRWYCTTTALSDGRIAAFGGTDEYGGNNRTFEFYRVGYGWSPETIAPLDPPLYPWMNQLPDGSIFYAGYTQDTYRFDAAAPDAPWSFVGTMVSGAAQRKYGASVLLPLQAAQGYRARVFMAGGADPDTGVATATAEMVNLSGSSGWQSLRPMIAPRSHLSAVLLPNGRVFTTGGSPLFKIADPSTLPAEIFNPTTKKWSSAGTATFPRLYHSCAVLLPDATVCVLGSNPETGAYESHAEIYSPPYLFRKNRSGQAVAARRPVISKAPEQIGYGERFKLTIPKGTQVRSIALMRPGSATHACDMEQRMIGLAFHAAGRVLTVKAPPNANIAPPGYYMIFLVNGDGVPSQAKFVQLRAQPGNQPPHGTITSPPGNVIIAAGETVNFAASATDADGSITRYSWVFPDAEPEASTEQNPGPITFDEAGTYYVSMTAVDNGGENDPSPPTRTITVLPSLGAGDVAEPVTLTAPETMAAGEHYDVTVVMKNTGTNTWTSAGNYQLGSQNPPDNVVWGVSRVALPGPVAPGESAIFKFNVLAPAAPDLLPFDWQMLHGNAAFGLALSGTIDVQQPVNSAAFVAQTVPPVMIGGHQYDVSITMKNLGTGTWGEGSGYELCSQNLRENFLWGKTRVPLPVGVLPGETVSVPFTVTAPLREGTYDFQWQVLHDNPGPADAWFGERSDNVQVKVRAPASRP